MFVFCTLLKLSSIYFSGKKKQSKQILAFCSFIAFIIFTLNLFLNRQKSYFTLQELQKPILFDSERLKINQKASCRGATLAINVISAVGNFERRQAIRNTWGSVSTSNGPVRLVFIVGKGDGSTQSLLNEESKKHRDIVQGDFMDTYRNLTLKSMTMVCWTVYECPQAKFLFKADDDTFINIPFLMMYLKYFGNKKNLLTGHLYTKSMTDRNISSKWYMSEAEYPSKKYPPYLSGGSYLMSTDVATRLLRVCSKPPYISMEDVFLTGICARRAQISPTNSEKFTYKKLLPVSGCTHKYMISGHDVSANEMKKIWNDILNLRKLKCKNSEQMKTKPVYKLIAKLSD